MQIAVNSSLYYQVYGPSAFLFALRCPDAGGQSVVTESLEISLPHDRADLSVGPPGNLFTRINIDEQGELAVNYSAKVEPSIHLIDVDQIADRPIESIGGGELPYLFPSRYAPSDLVRGAASDLFGGYSGSYATALAIEDWLFGHIAYQAGASTEMSAASDTLLSRAGVCRDFAHLGIAFCRALNLPARYLTIYAHGLEPQDFHAAFEVFIGGIWMVFDGTRKAPLNGMVRIASGRDAADVSMATIFGNVAGTGVEVQVGTIPAGDAPFSPITRESLRADGKSLYLG